MIYDQFMPSTAINMFEWVEVRQRKRKTQLTSVWFGRRKRKAGMASPHTDSVKCRSDHHVANIYPLLRLNRQIRREAAHQIFSTRTFRVFSQAWIEFNTRLPPEGFAFLRSIEILEFLTTSQPSYGKPLTDRFLSLRNLVVHLGDLHSPHAATQHLPRGHFLRIQNIGWLMQNRGLESFKFAVSNPTMQLWTTEREEALAMFADLEEEIAEVTTFKLDGSFHARIIAPIALKLRTWWTVLHLDQKLLTWTSGD